MPKEPEEPKRDKKDMWLSDLEYEVRNTMRDGQSLSQDILNEIIREMVNSSAANTKGFILDISFGFNKDEPTRWGKILVDEKILTG